MVFDPEHLRDLAAACGAYQRLMDEIVPESQYWQGKREVPERIEALGNIIERAAARARARERAAQAAQTLTTMERPSA